MSSTEKSDWEDLYREIFYFFGSIVINVQSLWEKGLQKSLSLKKKKKR